MVLPHLGVANEVDAGLERQDLLQLLKDIAVWESMPIHELKLEIAKSTGPAICDRGLPDLPGFCQKQKVFPDVFCTWMHLAGEESWKNTEISKGIARIESICFGKPSSECQRIQE